MPPLPCGGRSGLSDGHGASILIRMHTANRETAGEPAIFSAVIRPHRSLSPYGFLLLMGLLAGTALFAGLVFAAMGAWPVVGFLGLGVGLVWCAFRANYRAARAREFIDVTANEIRVRRVSAGGTGAEWRFNPSWVRFQIDRDEDHVVRGLALASHGRRLEIARWLSPPEKSDFAAALGAALAAAKRGPVQA